MEADRKGAQNLKVNSGLLNGPLKVGLIQMEGKFREQVYAEEKNRNVKWLRSILIVTMSKGEVRLNKGSCELRSHDIKRAHRFIQHAEEADQIQFAAFNAKIVTKQSVF